MGKINFAAGKYYDSSNNNIYRPEFFRLSKPDDLARFQTLVEETSGLFLHDEIKGQVGELIKSRHPSGISEDDFQSKEKELLDGRSYDEFGVWVYYPWLNRVVHILDEKEFAELRTNRNQNKILKEEQAILATKKIGIIGLSVGQSIALTLTMERGYGEIRLTDFDTLELSNLNRIRTPLYNLGEYKVIATAREIAEIDPFLTVKVFTEGLTQDNMEAFMLEGGKLDLLVDECDGLDMKIQAREFARKHRIPVIMDTSDRGMMDVERFDLHPDLPLLHGLVGDLDTESLKGLSNEQKIPFVLKILGADQLSLRARASALEVEQSISTWPQLASSVILGGAVGADVSRRILLDQFHQSGRYYVDVEEIISDPVEEEHEEIATGYDVEGQLDREQSLAIVDSLDIGVAPHQVLPDKDTVATLVYWACMAPSGGNCQPWKWVYRNGSFILLHDIARSASLLDFQHTGSYLAFGAAIENFVLKAHSMGYEVRTDYRLLNPDDRVIAVLTLFEKGFAGAPVEPHTVDDMVNYVKDRCTNRKVEGRVDLPDSVFEELKNAASSVKGGDMLWLSAEHDLKEFGKIIGELDRLWILDSKGHREFMKEFRWTKEEAERTRDGLDVETFELSKMDLAGLQLAKDHRVVSMLNQWGLGKVLTRMSSRAIGSASGVGLITMPSYSVRNFLDGGRSAERVWLKATELGLAVQPMTISTFLFNRWRYAGGEGFTDKMKKQLPGLIDQMFKLFEIPDDAGLIFLLKFSKAGPPTARSLRLPLEDVLFTD